MPKFKIDSFKTLGILAHCGMVIFCCLVSNGLVLFVKLTVTLYKNAKKNYRYKNVKKNEFLISSITWFTSDLSQSDSSSPPLVLRCDMLQLSQSVCAHSNTSICLSVNYMPLSCGLFHFSLKGVADKVITIILTADWWLLHVNNHWNQGVYSHTTSIHSHFPQLSAANCLHSGVSPAVPLTDWHLQLRTSWGTW